MRISGACDIDLSLTTAAYVSSRPTNERLHDGEVTTYSLNRSNQRTSAAEGSQGGPKVTPVWYSSFLSCSMLYTCKLCLGSLNKLILDAV